MKAILSHCEEYNLTQFSCKVVARVASKRPCAALSWAHLVPDGFRIDPPQDLAEPVNQVSGISGPDGRIHCASVMTYSRNSRKWQERGTRGQSSRWCFMVEQVYPQSDCSTHITHEKISKKEQAREEKGKETRSRKRKPLCLTPVSWACGLTSGTDCNKESRD